MTKIQDLRNLAHTIKTETKVGGNTADRVGSAFEGVADALEGTEQIAEMDKAVQEVQQQVEASKAQIQTLVNALPVVQQTGDSTTSVMSQKAVSDKLNAVDEKFTEEKNRVDVELGKKFDKASVVQESGEAEDKVMSQKAVTAKLSDLSFYNGKIFNLTLTKNVTYPLSLSLEKGELLSIEVLSFSVSDNFAVVFYDEENKPHCLCQGGIYKKVEILTKPTKIKSLNVVRDKHDVELEFKVCCGVLAKDTNDNTLNIEKINANIENNTNLLHELKVGASYPLMQGYLSDEGNYYLGDSSENKCTDFIYCTLGDVFEYSGVNRYNWASVFGYDKDKKNAIQLLGDGVYSKAKIFIDNDSIKYIRAWGNGTEITFKKYNLSNTECYTENSSKIVNTTLAGTHTFNANEFVIPFTPFKQDTVLDNLQIKTLYKGTDTYLNLYIGIIDNEVFYPRISYLKIASKDNSQDIKQWDLSQKSIICKHGEVLAVNITDKSNNIQQIICGYSDTYDSPYISNLRIANCDKLKWKNYVPVYCKLQSHRAFVQFPEMEIKYKKIVVSKDGYGDFTNITDAIKSAADTNYFERVIIEIYPGNYDIIEEQGGDEFINSVTNKSYGLMAPKFCKLQGIGEVNVIGRIDDSKVNENICTYVSTFNPITSLILDVENINFFAKNLRYVLHIDSSAPYSRLHFKNCSFTHEGNTDSNTFWHYPNACSMGVETGQNIKFENCIFNGQHEDFSVHDREYVESSPYITLDNCKLIGKGNARFSTVGKAASNTKKSFATVANCNLVSIANSIEGSGDSIDELRWEVTEYGNGLVKKLQNLVKALILSKDRTIMLPTSTDSFLGKAMSIKNGNAEISTEDSFDGIAVESLNGHAVLQTSGVIPNRLVGLPEGMSSEYVYFSNGKFTTTGSTPIGKVLSPTCFLLRI